MFNTLPKIHIKHLNWLMPLLLSGLMSGSISGFNLLLNKGLVHNFFNLWLKSWSLSWLIAFPLIMVFLPLVRKFLMQFALYTTNFTEPLSYQDSAFLKLPKFP